MKLATEIGNVDAEGAAHVSPVSEFFGHPTVGDDPTGVIEQGLKNLELRSGQGDLARAHERTARVRVDTR
jgi:hypothetical protein